jgi:tetratricopeptide (TPR) repeat protein
MGVAYNELGKYQEAIDAYKETIKIKPDYHMAYYNMGGAYNKLKEYQKAIDAYKEWPFDTFLIHYKQLPYCHKPHDNQA